MFSVSNRKKKTAAGTVYLTVVEVFVRNTSGLSAIPDRSFPDRSLACGIL
jgi:hypothetical protein